MSSGFVSAPARPTADSAHLVLPQQPASAPRASVPWLAASVPVVGALGLWAFTGALFALWFAALGPVIAVAGVLDGARTSRRARRAAAEEAAVVRARIAVQIDERQAAERSELRTRHPDVAGYLRHPEQVWRAVPDRLDTIVFGSGDVASTVRISGGGADEDVALVRRARAMSKAPVTGPLGSGLAVVGPPVAAEAVARAFVLQLALAHPPGSLHIVSVASEEWTKALPHSRVTAPLSLAIGGVGDAGVSGHDIAIVIARPGETLPPRCVNVVFLVSAEHARVDVGGGERRVAVEALSASQALLVALSLAARARDLAPSSEAARPLALAELALARREGRSEGLAVAVGRAGTEAAEVDLVSDGPHAIVTGMTGSGKSELLTSWIVALCTVYDTAAVSFLLLDFKGGTAFDALASLPHVTGVLTDLDGTLAQRAIESLSAELRHREGELARAGARQISETRMPRLVIVVDEFAALRQSHPGLETLFADIAARGRALGMHLILGTQRATGAVHDALLANCPLRLSLRLVDAADSRAVLGTDDAARLPGGGEGSGLAMLRRAGDVLPTKVRIAITSSSDIEAARSHGGESPRRPWLPPLPHRIPLEDLPPVEAGAIALGLFDDPERQRQGVVAVEQRSFLVVGGAGSGKSTALRVLASRLPAAACTWIGPDAEAAWDALESGLPPAPGSAVFIDDVDALAGRLPADYARRAMEELEKWIRGAGELGIRVFASAQRLSGAAGRLAELIPGRLILATPSRADHVAAGGDSASFSPRMPPGRGFLDGVLVQVALPPADAASVPGKAVTVHWAPPEGVTGYVARHAPAGVAERWERTGVRLRSVEGQGEVAEPVPGGRVVVVGEPEQWLARPRLLAQVRAGGGLVVDHSCAGDYRLLTGERDLPPFAESGRARAWECRSGQPVRRVVLEGAIGR